MHGKCGFVVEADVRGLFENLGYDWLLRTLALRIDDRVFLSRGPA